VARQYLGSVKTDNGIVAVTSLWADPRGSWPLHAVAYTPASRLAKGISDPEFRTKPQLAAELVSAAQQAKIPFRAVVADCFYGDNPGFVEALGRAGVAFVLALKPRKGSWAPDDAPHTPVEAARELGWGGPGGRGRGGGSPAGSGQPHRDLVGRRRSPFGGWARIGTTGWWWPPPTRSRCRVSLARSATGRCPLWHERFLHIGPRDTLGPAQYRCRMQGAAKPDIGPSRRLARILAANPRRRPTARSSPAW
jgi:DDE superfamily endonuclease